MGAGDLGSAGIDSSCRTRLTRVLVTGATGFVGSALVENLAASDYSVTAAVRRRAEHLPAFVEQAVVGDIGPETEWGEALRGVDLVVHLAARVHVMRETASDPDAAFEQVNGAGTKRLAEAAAGSAVRRMALISTIKVNGERTPLDRGFSGDQPPAPEDAYGRSKLSAERALRQAMGGRGVILRPPLVYGPGVGGNLAVLMKAVDRSWPLPFGAIVNRRSLIARANLVSAIVAALDHPAVAARTFTVSDGSDFSTPDLIRSLASAMGRRAWLPPVPVGLLQVAGRLLGRSGAVERLTGSLLVDPSAFMAATGWRPPVATDQAIREMTEHFLQA